MRGTASMVATDGPQLHVLEEGKNRKDEHTVPPYEPCDRAGMIKDMEVAAGRASTRGLEASSKQQAATNAAAQHVYLHALS